MTARESRPSVRMSCAGGPIAAVNGNLPGWAGVPATALTACRERHYSGTTGSGLRARWGRIAVVTIAGFVILTGVSLHAALAPDIGPRSSTVDVSRYGQVRHVD